MADFTKAFAKTMGHEGGWVDDKDDPGGQTYKGVSRRNHPDWTGWKKIDKLRKRSDFPKCLDSDAELQAAVQAFYKRNFWARFKGDKIADQALAEELFDTGVNMGVGQAVRFLQIALNLLNRNGLLYLDIEVDGGCGPKTCKALDTYLKHDKAELLLKVLNIQQGMQYLELMSENPVMEKYARGWLNRVLFERSA